MALLKEKADKALARAMDGHNFVLFRTDEEGRVLVKQPGGVVPHFMFENGIPKQLGTVAVSHALTGNDDDVSSDELGVVDKPAVGDVAAADSDSWLWRQVAVFPMISALFLRGLEGYALIILADWVWREYYRYVTQPYNVGLSYMFHIFIFLCVTMMYGAWSYLSISFANKCVDALMRLACGKPVSKNATNNGKVVETIEAIESAAAGDHAMVTIDPNMNFAMRFSQTMICYAIRAAKYMYLLIPVFGFLSMFGLLCMCLYSKPIPVQEILVYANNVWSTFTSPISASYAYNAYRPGGAAAGGHHTSSQAPPMGAMGVPPFRR
jgi:hypothetical protein